MGQKINFSIASELASGATGGIVLGDFNNWNETDAIKLKVQKDGSLKASAVLEAGKSYQYRYLLNDGRWVNDSNANSYHYDPVFNVENCVIHVKEKATRGIKTEAEKKQTAKKEKTTSVEKKTKVSSKPAKKSKA